MPRRCLALLALCLPWPAAAADQPSVGPERRASLGGSVNPPGVQAALDVTWKHEHVSFGVSPKLTPAYGRLSAWAEWSPHPALGLRALVEPTGYFGTFGHLLGFDGYDAPFGIDDRRARDDEAAAGRAARVQLNPKLQARVGRLVILVRAEFDWWWISGAGPFVYEPSRDTLLRASGDSVMATQGAVLWEARGGAHREIYVGAVHELLRVPEAPDNRRQAVGMLCAWSLGERKLGLSRPSVGAKVLYYLEDPSKRHQLAAEAGLSAAIGGE